MITELKDLDVYNLSYESAMEIFMTSRNFPKEELYSLTSQIVRSSRSVSADISEGWAKREYENIFKNHLISSIVSASETQTWLSFAKDCGYLDKDKFDFLNEKYNSISKMLTRLHQNWKKFPPNS